MNRSVFFAIILFPLLCLSAVSCGGTPYGSAAGSIPIQHKGRLKPFDSFARQTLNLMTGHERWNDKGAVAVLMEGLSDREKMAEWKWLRIDYTELKKELNLAEERFYSLTELKPAFPRIQSLVQEAKAKRDSDERPTKLEQKAELLFAKIITAQDLLSGESVRVLPSTSGRPWASPYVSEAPEAGAFKQLVRAQAAGSAQEADAAAQAWIRRIKDGTREVDFRKISAEVFYNRSHLFEWAWLSYFAAFLAFLWAARRLWARRAGFVFFLAGFGFHTAGILCRIYVMSRPPVSNMYESMIFMNWAVAVFAFLFWCFSKRTAALTAASFLSAMVMIYADLLPIDASMDVLVPVLRSNYWLSIHVMTVVSSYGAFGLAMALGHAHLIRQAFGKLPPKEEEASADLIYRVIQLGVLLIGTGTVLGGVWANESWGRFWGWDPKETWALITFLGYLVIIHLKFAKRLTHFALALSSVLGFLLVLMTWYGVNFVLGRGLHSYGAGTGGMNWVLYYLVFEAFFVGFVLVKLKGRRPVGRA